MSEQKKRFNVVCPVDRKDGKTSWLKVGVGFTNRDNSINMILDAYPVNQRLQLRDADEEPRFAGDGARGGGRMRTHGPGEGVSEAA